MPCKQQSDILSGMVQVTAFCLWRHLVLFEKTLPTLLLRKRIVGTKVPYFLATRFSIIIINSYEEKEKRKVDAKLQLCVSLAFYVREMEDSQCRLPSQGMAGSQNFVLQSQ
jgi:hypothetical protein